MSSERELTRVVRSWLEEGLNVLPDRVLDDVLAQIPVTSQRRPVWRAWRRQLMNATTRLAIAAVAAFAVVAVGLTFIFSRPPIEPSATSSPSPSVGPTQTATGPVDSPSPSTPPSLLPLRGMPGTSYSPAGDYGWQGSVTGDSGAGMHWFKRGGGPGSAERELGDIVFRVGARCDGSPGLSDAPAIPVRVGGYDAVYVEPHEPPVSYNGPTGDETTRAYKVDVDGRSLCIYVTWHATTTDREIDALFDVIDSLRAQLRGHDDDVILINFTLDEGWDVG